MTSFDAIFDLMAAEGAMYTVLKSCLFDRIKTYHMQIGFGVLPWAFWTAIQ